MQLNPEISCRSLMSRNNNIFAYFTNIITHNTCFYIYFMHFFALIFLTV